MPTPAGCEADLRAIDEDIATLGGTAALDPPTDASRVTRYVYRLYQRASIAGDLTALITAERSIERAAPLLTYPGDLCLLKANIALKLHRLIDAETALEAIPSVCDSAEGRLIRADLDFQRGRYRPAREGYASAVDAERSWGALARLAHFVGRMGDPARADQLYDEAQDELTAKQLRAFAWLEVQRGFLDFAQGRFDQAAAHYRRADKAYPGYWLTDEHIAELLAAEGRYGEARVILMRLAAGGSRPDLEQAIAEICDLAGESEAASHWSQRALRGYLCSVERGEVHFWHHLADYYTEVARDGPQAVVWARKDLRLRQNFATEATLAAALYRAGRFVEARHWIDQALASGVVDARLFDLAGHIHIAAGSAATGKSFRYRATRLNPLADRFHLHH